MALQAQAATDAQAPLPNRPDLPLGGASLERFKWAISVGKGRQAGCARGRIASSTWSSQCSPPSPLGWPPRPCPQVVHSRTFANAARTGGVGVRMLVPIVDMLNHGGDVTASGLMHDGNIVATDNVR